ncbi:C4-dicarboxylate ABC transporter substrate-binding protein [Alkalispirochaeta sphaeroplastigenens]|uniref:C4-dicarboxylate ABC transporter substrate-binding protein n=1 Tax=Alkalispirochaeta sphaeroplastigenens TaxID=1187066 RepID=A0A2S4K1I0_9SPIO|nr:C4-dicarboxylate TRAP transporter substrate-binding protein [Alkalispirochaeta sphaeroplastigenens]POR05623.1 C4-dicarboxylate ABC transporter substrate-binding protein [Alkalispirochaeta sphaeroplastigenens]
MNKMKTLGLVALMVCAATTALYAGGRSEAKDGDDYKLVLRLSHVFNPVEQLSQSMDWVAERIYERTNGAIEIQTFPQAQLAAYKEGVEQVVRGANFISVEDPSFIGDYVPDMKALYAPMLYQSFDEYVELVRTELVQDMMARAEEQGIKILALDYIYGFRNMMTRRPVRTPEDLSGLQIRVPGTDLYINTLNNMGAIANPLPWGETLSAVQQGVVDGLEGSEFTNIGNKVFETGAVHVGLTRHILGTCGVYINIDVWNRIPEQYREIIQEEFTKGAAEGNAILMANHADVVAELEANGVQFHEVDGDAFRARLAPMYREQPGMTPGIFDAVFAELDAIRN